MANENFSLSHPFAGSFLSGFNPDPTALGLSGYLSGLGGGPLSSLIYAVIRGFSVRAFYAAYVICRYCKAHSMGLWCFSGVWEGCDMRV